MSQLNNLTSLVTRSKKRIGRGYGSGKGGHTVGRGQKGQGSRVGANIPVWFEGGQLPIIKRLPMWRGKSRLSSTSKTAILTLNDLNSLEAKTVSLETLKLAGLVKKSAKQAKIIASGEVKKALKIDGLQVTAGAQAAIEKAGGSAK